MLKASLTPALIVAAEVVASLNKFPGLVRSLIVFRHYGSIQLLVMDGSAIATGRMHRTLLKTVNIA